MAILDPMKIYYMATAVKMCTGSNGENKSETKTRRKQWCKSEKSKK